MNKQCSEYCSKIDGAINPDNVKTLVPPKFVDIMKHLGRGVQADVKIRFHELRIARTAYGGVVEQKLKL